MVGTPRRSSSGGGGGSGRAFVIYPGNGRFLKLALAPALACVQLRPSSFFLSFFLLFFSFFFFKLSAGAWRGGRKGGVSAIASFEGFFFFKMKKKRKEKKRISWVVFMWVLYVCIDCMYIGLERGGFPFSLELLLSERNTIAHGPG